MWDQVLNIYCERGANPSFWGEPLNAITNASFIIAAALLLPRAREDGRALSSFLVGTVFVIGVGSFLFHTLATRWSGAVDVFPILVFMLAAVFALTRRALDGPWWLGVIGVAGFVGLSALVRVVGPQIAPGLGAFLLYAPAVIVLFIAAAGLIAAGVSAGSVMFAAAVVFLVSLTFRTLDQPFCGFFTIGDVAIGSHFIWHVLNGVTLYLVTRAVIALPDPALTRRGTA